MYLSAQLCRLLEFFRARRSFHFARKLTLQAFEISG